MTSKKSRSKKSRSRRSPIKNRAVKNVVEQTKQITAMTTGMVVIGSMPDTPQAPAMSQAKTFTGNMWATGQIVSGSKGLLDSLKSLERISPRRKRRR